MTKLVIFRTDQEVNGTDLTNAQAFQREAIDTLTADAVTVQRRYSGLNVTQTSTTDITVAPGRLYNAGAQHEIEIATNFALLSRLPVATKRIVALVAWGVDVDSDVQPRDFLIDVDTGATEPQAVAMQNSRVVSLDLLSGVEGADPQVPAIGSNTLLVATITLGTTGILSIEMNADNALQSTEVLRGRVVDLEAWRSAAGALLETLASDYAALAARTGGLASASLLEDIISDVAELRERQNLVSGALSYGTDLLVDEQYSDTTRAGYQARVDEGLGFADEAQSVGLVAAFNVFDSNIRIYGNGLLLPAHTHEMRLNIPGLEGSVSLTEYSSTAWNAYRWHLARARTRWGNRWRYWRNITAYSQRRRVAVGPLGEPVGSPMPLPPAIWRKTESGELESAFQSNAALDNRQLWKYSRPRRWFRRDWWNAPYWPHVRTLVTVTGSLRYQSILNQQDGWLTRLSLWFTDLAATGDVRVLICEAPNNRPKMDAVLAETTISRASMQLYPAATVVDIGPVYLRSGQRVAVVLISSAAHRVALGQRLAYTSGVSGYSLDGSFFTASATADIKLRLYYARFNASAVQVQLAPLALSGGISDVDLIESGWTPDAASITYEVQAPGGQWTEIGSLPEEANEGPLVALPPLMNFRANLSGTRDAMPGINLADTQQYVSRPRTSFTHFSTRITLAAPSSTIKIKCLLNDFDEDDHNFTVTLLRGASIGTEVVEAADTTEDEIIEGGRIMRTFTFNTAAPVSQFVIKSEGATLAATSVFNVETRTFMAL